ncbi:MAG: PEGA domain-containing protein [Bacteroidota bacterium]
MSIVPGSAKEEPAELVSKDIRDDNGVTTAGLIIFSDLKGLTFQSYNGVVKMNRNPGKDFLFLSPDERVVEVYCFGYTPLKIMLNELGIKLKSGQTWSVKITGDKKLDLIPVNLLIDQEGAQIFIDGVDKGSLKSHQLSVGKHGIRIEKPGYITLTDSIDVSQNNSLFSFKLPELDMIGITINSIPQEAKIYIDEVEKGETNKGLFLYPGKYKLRLSKGGYSDSSVTINVSETAKKELTIALVKNTGLFTFTVQPADAVVLVNKENVSGKGQVDLTPGTYKVEVSRENYYPTSEVIEVGKNKGLQRSFVLKPKVGTYQFSASPAGSTAQLVQGGVVMKQWSGLTRFKDLMIGTYTLTVTLQGYDPYTKTVTIRENESSVDDVVLKKAVFGSVKVTASPSYASISLYQNGTFVKTLQNGVVEGNIRPGSYKAKVSYSGYESDEVSLTVVEGGTAAQNVSLDAIVYKEPRESELFFLFAQYGLDGEPKGGNQLHFGWGMHLDMETDGIFFIEMSQGIFIDKLVKEQPSVKIEQDWSGMSVGFGFAMAPVEDSFIEIFGKYDARIQFSGKEKMTYFTTSSEKELLSDFYSSRWMYGFNIFPSNSLMLKLGLFSQGDMYEDDDSSLGKINDSTGKLVSAVDKRTGYFAELSIIF